jgi:enamine deaminase RidA (YjgF/YER057c/UK114 family)
MMPQPTPPGGAYTPVVVHAGVAYVSAQLPRRDGEVVGIGKLGSGLDLAAGREAARLSALQCLAALEHVLGGLDRVERLLHLTGYVAAAPGFVQLSAVVDGASECMVEVLGARGLHARTTVGVAELPRGVAVEVAVVAAVRA